MQQTHTTKTKITIFILKIDPINQTQFMKFKTSVHYTFLKQLLFAFAFRKITLEYNHLFLKICLLFFILNNKKRFGIWVAKNYMTHL